MTRRAPGQRALHLLTRFLPREVRDTYEEEWATELTQSHFVPGTLWHLALAVPRLAVEEHSGVLHLEPAAVRRRDWLLHRSWRGIVLAFVLFTLLADLIYAYSLVTHGSDAALWKLLLFNVLLLGYWQIVSRGAFWDAPWLRTTRLATVIKGLWLGLPVLLVFPGAGPDGWPRFWALGILMYLPWQAYWNVHRPLRPADPPSRA